MNTGRGTEPRPITRSRSRRGRDRGTDRLSARRQHVVAPAKQPARKRVAVPFAAELEGLVADSTAHNLRVEVIEPAIALTDVVEDGGLPPERVDDRRVEGAME